MENYYVSQRQVLLDGFDSLFADAQPLLVPLCGEADAREVLTEARPEFEVLIPQLPYIGGRSNALTDCLVMSAWFLAFFRVMRRFGHRPQRAYFVLYRIVEAWLARDPAASTRLSGDYRFSPLYLESLQRHADRSQRREFLGDWVYAFVDGGGSDFDYGVDYAECGICKFFRDQGEEALIPYMCALDFPLARACGLELKRSTTLGDGKPVCDFRLSRRPALDQPDMTMQDIGVP